jgi:hypothetical protein
MLLPTHTMLHNSFVNVLEETFYFFSFFACFLLGESGLLVSSRSIGLVKFEAFVSYSLLQTKLYTRLCCAANNQQKSIIPSNGFLHI